ncbi:hypothetical protein BX600DRAFT_435470 [Xylariales sp. PMI_506]|nr:hypothetical protein BX600DRAFT_435470 [Xylariales sp. PMI_506]
MEKSDYRPVAWSIGYMAVNDPTFKGCRWVFGKHAISEAIGDNATDLWAEYLSQITQYNQVRDHKIDQIIEDPLDDSRNYLRPSLREQLKNWLDTFKSCEEIIMMCEGMGQATPKSWIFRVRRAVFRVLCQTTDGDLPEEHSRAHRHAPGQAAPAAKAKALWARQRPRFLELLEQLNRHVLFFSSQIKPKQSGSGVARLLEAPQRQLYIHRQINRYRDAGARLKALIESLRKLELADKVAFELMLHCDPLVLASDFRAISPICEKHMPYGSAAFYFRLAPETNDAAGDRPLKPGPSRSSPQSVFEAQFFVFGVPESAGSAEKQSGGIRHIGQLFQSTPQIPVGRPDWAGYRGGLSDHIQVLSDSTAHMAKRSLVACLADYEEQRILRKASYASMRTDLALRVAIALFYNLRVDGWQDLHAQDFHFYTALNRKKQEPEYKNSRIMPYIALSTLGSTAVAPSSSDALSGATGELEVMMLQNLGILIYEIGAWSRVTGRGLAERVSKVKKDKEHLVANISATYRDVIDACFRYRKEDSVADWMIRNVLIPLKEVSESLKRAGVKPA